MFLLLLRFLLALGMHHQPPPPPPPVYGRPSMTCVTTPDGHGGTNLVCTAI